MKTIKVKEFRDLSKEKQKALVDREISETLQMIVEGRLSFQDDDGDLQVRINNAFLRAEKMMTPWFTNEYIMDTCHMEITDMANMAVRDRLYNDGEAYIDNI